MPERRLKVYDPRVSVKSDSGIRLCRPTVAMVDDCMAWILQQFWSRPSLRPAGWNGRLTRDEALRLILHHFAEAYGVPLNTDAREEECQDQGTPA